MQGLVGEDEVERVDEVIQEAVQEAEEEARIEAVMVWRRMKGCQGQAQLRDIDNTSDMPSNGRRIRTYRANSVVSPLNEYTRQMTAVLWSVPYSCSSILLRSVYHLLLVPSNLLDNLFVPG